MRWSLLFLVVALFTACSGVRDSQVSTNPDGCERRYTLPPVAHLETDTMLGSATYLGNGIWLTNRHVLEDSTDVRLDRARFRIDHIDEGEGTGFENDWVVFKSAYRLPGNYPVDFEVSLPEGAELLIMGYPVNGQSRYKGMTLSARVSKTPEGIEQPENIIVLDPGAAGVQNNDGLSGSPLLWLNPKTKQWTIVGIYCGSVTYNQPMWPWGSKETQNYIGVRP
ncbi:MAG: trypsin-like peptidase domain-containing protein [Bdellovibrionales bacterium]|nr:trypsin-like peptidase domain-containing protein [Bdellovibrionales bacterium]